MILTQTHHLDQLCLQGVVILAGTTKQLVILDNAPLSSKAAARFVGLQTTMEGVQFWFVDSATPTINSTPVGPARYLRPFELTTEQPWSAASIPALVLANPTFYDARLSLALGIGGVTAGRKYVVNTVFDTMTRAAGKNYSSVCVEIAWTSDNYSGRKTPFFAGQDWLLNQPVTVGDIAAGDVALRIPFSGPGRRSLFAVQSSQTGSPPASPLIDWAGSDVELNGMWVTTDSQLDDPTQIDGSAVGRYVFVEGELETDFRKWSGAPSGGTIVT